jgi:hypothetical protein
MQAREGEQGAAGCTGLLCDGCAWCSRCSLASALVAAAQLTESHRTVAVFEGKGMLPSGGKCRASNSRRNCSSQTSSYMR